MRKKNDLQELHAEEQAWIFNESELSDQLRESCTSHQSLSVVVRKREESASVQVDSALSLPSICPELEELVVFLIAVMGTGCSAVPSLVRHAKLKQTSFSLIPEQNS